MSYEFEIRFGAESVLRRVVRRLQMSHMLNHHAEGALTFKDPQLGSSAAYDMGCSWEDGSTMSIDLVFKSRPLYAELTQSLAGESYRCIDETDEEVSLEQIFRMTRTRR